jgi:glucose-6-phosphate isomerase, archaeal
MGKTINATVRELEKNGKHGVRRLKDLKNLFLNQEKVKEILRRGENPIIYETFVEDKSPMKLGLTVMNSGKIGKEFYFTKGHIHLSKSEEFYILMEGKGKLLKQKGNKTRVINLKKGDLALIGKGEAHRLINTGRRKLKVLTIYHERSKPDYSVKFKKRFFEK